MMLLNVNMYETREKKDRKFYWTESLDMISFSQNILTLRIYEFFYAKSCNLWPTCQIFSFLVFVFIFRDREQIR